MFIQEALRFVDKSFNSTEQRKPKALSRRGLLVGASALGAVFSTTLVPSETTVRAATAVLAEPPVVVAAAALPDLPHVFATRSAADLGAWAQFKARFIRPEGRVVDSGNQGISHTEGQGLGMLFAVASDDRDTFDRLWTWTSAKLRRGGDALHSWRYVPGAANPVSDTNNATDGDIYIAGALTRASVLWNAPEYLAAARAITRDVLALTVRDAGGRAILLPGAHGFEKADCFEVNLSYYVFPLLADLQTAFASPLLAKVIEDGRRLIADAQFGKRRLPPDWLRVARHDGALSVAPQRPARFSFDAVRIPLFLAWAGGTAADLSRFSAFWGENPAGAAAWVDLETDATAPYRASNGVIAIAMITAHHRQALPPVAIDDDYYSAALNITSRIAAREVAFRFPTVKAEARVTTTSRS